MTAEVLRDDDTVVCMACQCNATDWLLTSQMGNKTYTIDFV